MISDIATLAHLRNRQLGKSVEQLLGMVTGMLADDHLHDMEIRFLQTWLEANAEVAAAWPGSAVASAVRGVLADGCVTEEERVHLMATLKLLGTTDFAATGSASPEVIALPFDHECGVELRDRGVCHTGEFLHGTRVACERTTAAAGGVNYSTVSKKVHFLVVGTNVSPNWAHTSYGRKIEQAVTLKGVGHPIFVISERRWLDALTSVA